MDEVTINGTEFLKYGRYGKPHKRMVSFDSAKSCILWRDSKIPTEKPRSIFCSDIINVIIGSDHTPVMKKHLIPIEFDQSCISIISKKRTLDLRHDD
jgi:hypothetical protein